jgi:hypothetical protein
VTGFPAGETVTIVRTGTPTQDQYGNDVAGSPTEIDVPGCAVAPRTSNEDVTGRDQVIEGLTVWMPAGTDVRPTDRVRRAGVLYDIDGDAGAWTSPFTGFAAPVQISLARVTG